MTIKTAIQKRLHSSKSTTEIVDDSFAGEYQHLAHIFSSIGIPIEYVIDIAASDGVTQSCTYPFYKQGANGIALEMDPSKFASLSATYASFPEVILLRTRVTPSTIGTLLTSLDCPLNPSLLNLDIDSFDLELIEAILGTGIRPAVISMEINEKIPPPIYFSVKYDQDRYWAGDHFYGCSLTAASSIVKPFGYFLESLQFNNAIFIRSDYQKSTADLSALDAYTRGYVLRPDRELLFPWNRDFDNVIEMDTEDALKFISEFFEPYSGAYDLYISGTE